MCEAIVDATHPIQVKNKMSALHLPALLFAVAVASYAQAVTGFAFGLILVGIVSSLKLVPLELIATTVSILSIVNGTPALLRSFCQIRLALFLPTAIFAAAAVVIGFELNRQIDPAVVPILKALVGAAVLAASLMLALPVRTSREVSGFFHSAAYGCVAGLMGGLFASSGPPLVYHFYRQPIAAEAVKATLVGVSVVAGLSRLAMSSIHGELGLDSVVLSAQSLPIVATMSWLTSRFAPNVSQAIRRRVASAVLALTSIALIWPSIGSAQTWVANLVPNMRHLCS